MTHFDSLNKSKYLSNINKITFITRLISVVHSRNSVLDLSNFRKPQTELYYRKSHHIVFIKPVNPYKDEVN